MFVKVFKYKKKYRTDWLPSSLGKILKNILDIIENVQKYSKYSFSKLKCKKEKQEGLSLVWSTYNAGSRKIFKILAKILKNIQNIPST